MNREEFEAQQQAIPDDKLVEMAQNALSKLCETGGRSLTMTVPPRVDDTDMIISELIRRFKDRTPLPPAEGAEENVIYHNLTQPFRQILQSVALHGYDIVFAEQDCVKCATEFATLHAQRIADKMVSERLREELIDYDNWMTKTNIGGGVSHPIEYFIDAYLKETGKCDVSAGKNVTKCHVNDVKNVTTEEDDDTLTPQDFFNLTSNHPLGVQARLKELGLFQVVCAEMKQYAKQFATLHAQRIAEKIVEEKLKKEYERGIEDGKIIGKHGSASYIE